jgi:hypothetical protein
MTQTTSNGKFQNHNWSGQRFPTDWSGTKFGGFASMGYPLYRWLVYNGQSQSNMDDN